MSQQQAEAAMVIQATMRGKQARDELATMQQGIPLLEHKQPNPQRVKRIVAGLPRRPDGRAKASGVRSMLSTLLEVSEEAIPESHPEVTSFSILSSEAMATKLCMTVEKERIDAYYGQLFPKDFKEEEAVKQAHEDTGGFSLLEHNVPNRRQVEKIVASIDDTAQREAVVEAVKLVFSRLLDVPASLIPDQHPEITSFLSQTPAERVEKLCLSLSYTQVERCYEMAFPPATEEEQLAYIRPYIVIMSIYGNNCLITSILLPYRNNSRLRSVSKRSLAVGGRGRTWLT